MNLQNRIRLLTDLGIYLKQNGPAWQEAKEKASAKNHWFTPAFIELATNNIIDEFLDEEKLRSLAKQYHLDDNITPRHIGIVMAGNIPMVGFHDFLCVFLCGHRQTIKLSSKDDVLLKHIVEFIISYNPELRSFLQMEERLSGCDAYIATGSNSTADVFETYFGKYPSIIRKNRTSIALLNGEETDEALQALAADVHTYFGLGCRNVTKILVPEGYDFIPLIKAFDQYAYFRDHHAYSNNYDYQLALLLLNHVPYMSSQATLFAENKSPFSPMSVLHYEYYSPATQPLNLITDMEDIQAIIGHDGVPFGSGQKPTLNQYADGVDTMQFLLGL